MLTKNPDEEKTFKNMLDDLFIKGYNILRKNGCIYYVISEKHINNILIPFMNTNYLQTLMSYESYYNDMGLYWKFITMKVKDLDFFIDENKNIIEHFFRFRYDQHSVEYLSKVPYAKHDGGHILFVNSKEEKTMLNLTCVWRGKNSIYKALLLQIGRAHV